MDELKYFPSDQEALNFILDNYADEIRLRTEWIVATANEVNDSLKQSKSASTVIRKAMDLIGNAVVILRILDSTGARRNEIERTEERIRLIKERWPKLSVNPPDGLRDVRNDYEHFDARLDQWAVSSERRLIADMNIGPIIGGFGVHENLRRFEGDTLYFWDKSVNLSEVVTWAQAMAAAVSERNEENELYDINCPLCKQHVTKLPMAVIEMGMESKCENCGLSFQFRHN